MGLFERRSSKADLEEVDHATSETNRPGDVADDPPDQGPSVTARGVSSKHSLKKNEAPHPAHHPLSHAAFHFLPHSSANSRASSAKTSSSSLQALNEDTVTDARSEPTSALSRTALGKRLSQHFEQHSQPLAPTTLTVNTAGDFPVYPDQSYAVLQSQVYPRPYQPHLRGRSSYPSPTDYSREYEYFPPGARTTGNTPISSPGLFSGRSARTSPSIGSDEGSRSGSPYLHSTHLQPPKETHTAEVDRDLATGNKLINDYEILEELGRGEHGKVKLGRHLPTKQRVAIKIVQRYSKRRRLGRLGDPEDKVKKEVAILKKARHPNVVSLLEVIDDPNRQKVYIVLEFIENGEIKWRKKGIREIVQLDKIRMERDKNGIPDPPEFEEDGQQMVRALQHKRRVKAYQSEKRRTQSHSQPHFLIPAWSLEHGGESDDELGAELALARTASRNLGAAPDPSESHPSPSQSYTSSTSESDRRMRESVMAAVEGSMYGPYVPDYPQERRYSAASSLFAYPSSDAERFADDDDMSYVPCLTIEEARNAFRDAVLGLEYLHYQGIIHRDIKPANLLVTFNCQVKISDFGVSYLGRPIREEDEEQVTETDATELDDARGELSKTVGTPAFYAPELCYSGDDFVDAQGRGPKITAAIDIWSLGVTLYGMIFGRLPFVSDDEYSLFQSIGKNELFIPSKRLKPVEVDPAPSMSEHGQVMNSNKRLDEEFKYEEIDHTLRDLLARLLAKDPQRRITIKEIKEHPWVREGLMEDPDAWAKQTDPQSKGNRIEVSNEEVTSAVSKVPFVDRVRSQVAKWSGYIVGRREKRTPSAAGSTTDSATSKDSREGRRASLRGDEEIFRTPKGHRESDHPLSQSVTASPLGLGDRESSFNRGPRHGEPTLTDDQKQRPPERVSSAISTAESTKTVTPWPSELAPFIEPQSHPSTVADTPASNHLGALFSGSGHRPGKDFSHSGPHHGRSRSLDRASVEGDVHSEPSLAISAASATGRVQTPSAWNDGGHHHAQYDIPGDLGHRRGRSSQSTRDHSTAVFSFVRETLPSQANPQHQDIARGDHITHLIDDEARSNGRLPADNGEAGSPSPQDNGDGLPSHRSPFESTHHVPGSGFTTSPPSAATISTTSMDEYASEMSQSASHPSIPSVISGASSLSADGFQAHMKEREKESDTPYVHPILRTGETITAKNYTGQPLHEEEESRYDCDDEDGDSEDEGIVFGKKKQAT